jgi:hypothetical protein
LNTRTRWPAGVAEAVGCKAAVDGRGEGGIGGGIRDGVVDRLGRLPGEGVAGESVGGENGGGSSNTATAGGMGCWGCEAAVGNGPVAEDGEGGRIGEVGVVLCSEGVGNDEDGDVRGETRRLISFSPSLSNSTSHHLFATFRIRFMCNQVMVQW